MKWDFCMFSQLLAIGIQLLCQGNGVKQKDTKLSIEFILFWMDIYWYIFSFHCWKCFILLQNLIWSVFELKISDFFH